MKNQLNNIKRNTDKKTVFSIIQSELHSSGLNIEKVDMERPWGGFFVIAPGDLELFRRIFFPELELSQEQKDLHLSPKILVVAPFKKLSWQYHHRRAEVWKLLKGDALISRSSTDQEQLRSGMEENSLIELAQGERHRLIGGREWSIVAEIWIHTSADHPSDESDIVRIADDYKRS